MSTARQRPTAADFFADESDSVSSLGYVEPEMQPAPDSQGETDSDSASSLSSSNDEDQLDIQLGPHRQTSNEKKYLNPKNQGRPLLTPLIHRTVTQHIDRPIAVTRTNRCEHLTLPLHNGNRRAEGLLSLNHIRLLAERARRDIGLRYSVCAFSFLNLDRNLDMHHPRLGRLSWRYKQRREIICRILH